MSENIKLMMPIKAAPYDHQKKAFAFACDKFGVFDERLKSRGTALLMEMGTGKTIVSIAVAGCMYQYGKVNRVLVVAPLSILGVWEEEFEKFADFPYSLTILKGTSAKKKEQLTRLPDEGLQIVVVNYESAWRLEKELLAYNAGLVIADEAHKLKENRTSQSKGMHHIGDKRDTSCSSRERSSRTANWTCSRSTVSLIRRYSAHRSMPSVTSILTWAATVTTRRSFVNG